MTDSATNSPATLDPEEILERFGGRDTFRPYTDYLLSENQKINLVSRETSETDLYKLIAGSLVPIIHKPILFSPQEKTRRRLVDVGSGGGLPALPLALALKASGTECDLTLVERTGKKSRFLQQALDRLGLSGNVLAENFSESVTTSSLKKTVNAPGLATLRWVKLDNRLLDSFANILSPTGTLIYYSEISDSVQFNDSWTLTEYHYSLSGDTQGQRTLSLLTRA